MKLLSVRVVRQTIFGDISSRDFRRFFQTSSINLKKLPNNLKGRSKSSQEWLTRHLNDPYVKRSRFDNYRARSAYKLVEIDDKYKILKPGMKVLDCGASPGAWSQVASERVNATGADETNSTGFVVAVDLNRVYPIDGVTVVTNDFTADDTRKCLTDLLTQRNLNKFDVVLSDMAPNATGVRYIDQELMLKLIYSALRFSLTNLAKDGSFLCKIWSGMYDDQFESDSSKYFKKVKRVKPDASRSDSKEFFFLCTEFRGIVEQSG
ncbi:Uncharacterised protein g253 [Pycnogonum litorale]